MAILPPQKNQRIEGKPSRSFPILVTDAPKEAKTLAVFFRDYDSVPVCGFTWIHRLAANLPTAPSVIFIAIDQAITRLSHSPVYPIWHDSSPP